MRDFVTGFSVCLSFILVVMAIAWLIVHTRFAGWILFILALSTLVGLMWMKRND